MKKPRRRRKWGRSIKRLILEKLNDASQLAWDAFFPRNYAAAAFWRDVFGVDRPRSKISRLPHRTLSTTLSRLTREGLIARRTAKGKSVWEITADGTRWLEEIEDSFDLPAEDGITRLVIFDIPEKQRKKRDRIRIELVACGFLPLQKSVWTGMRPLPEHFISLLDELDLRGNVHIFSVRESGTLDEDEDE